MKSQDISIAELYTMVWTRKSFIIKVCAVFIVIGVIYALTAPKEWQSGTVLLPEAQSSSGIGSLGNLAGLAGINLSGIAGGEEGINPELYAGIVGSTSFLIELRDQEYYFERLNETMTLGTYFSEHADLGIVGWVMSRPTVWFGSDEQPKLATEVEQANDFIRLSQPETLILKELRSRISVSVDRQFGYVSIFAKMQDAVVSAQVAKFTREYITNYVIEYYKAKDQRQLDFISSQVDIKKAAYEEKQKELSNFLDGNIRLSMKGAQAEQTRLQNEHDLAFNVYSALAQQLEDAKIKVEEATQVFVEIEPISIPPLRYSPKRKIIVIGFFAVGLLLSMGFVISKGLFTRK